MITEQDLREAIAECEGQRNPNSSTCIKLAAFYIILDHLFKKSEVSTHDYSFASEPVSSNIIRYESNSEFMKMIKDKNINDILPIMDELMNTLQIINPRLYDGVMSKLYSETL